MRKTLLTGVLGLALIMGGCTSTESAGGAENSGVNFYTANEKNFRDILEVSGKEVKSEDFTMNLEFEKNMIVVAVTNTSEEVIIVDWEHALYTGLDNEEQKVFNMKQKDKGLYTRQMAIPLRPGQSYIAEIVPVKNLHYTPGISTGLGNVYIEKDLFSEGAAERKKDYAKLEIPVTVGGVKRGVVQRYEVYFGDGETPEELTAELDAREDKLVAAPAPVKKGEPAQEIREEEVLRIKDENELLENEIKAKEELIKQLNERARLQKELEERQREIDALMQQIN